MNTIRRVILGAILAISLPACADSRPTSVDETPLATRTFLFADGAGALGRVERTITTSGEERLHGQTEIQSDGGHFLVVEDATLDSRGRLVHAETAIAGRCAEVTEQRIVYDAASGVVRIVDAGGEKRFSVPVDAPWVLSPARDAEHRPIATAVSGWIAIRAAALAPSLRVIDAASKTAYAVSSDQIAVATERGTTAVLGDAGIDAGPEFVEELRLVDLNRTMTRVAVLPARNALQCGQTMNDPSR
ncbi:MAG: hypothetical protein ABJE95_02570 [Byssovorax sp.]